METPIPFTMHGPRRRETAADAPMDTLFPVDPPAAAGALIYRGDVFDPRSPSPHPVYTYERRVADRDGVRTAAHTTFDAGGTPVLVEQTQVAADGTLLRFDAASRQLGSTGAALPRADGRIDFRLRVGGRLRTASEPGHGPVVAGPSLHGFILRHWDALAEGRAMRVRMIALAELRTYRFDLRRLAEREGRVAVRLTPSHWLLRLVLAPLVVTFDAATGQVVRYEGRVPPKIARRGRWKAFDARVEYTMAATDYA